MQTCWGNWKSRGIKVLCKDCNDMPLNSKANLILQSEKEHLQNVTLKG